MIASAEIKNMYIKLLNRKDYPDSISDFNQDLLEEYYNNFLPEIERDIQRAKKQFVEWKKILSGSNAGANKSLKIFSFSLIASKYFGRKNNYTDGLRLIKYWTDSVLQPLTVKYGSNEDLIKMRRSVDIYWMKYYLYTGKPDDALRVAMELSHANSKTINYNLYLVAAYLASDKYAEATALFKSIANARGWRMFSERIFQNLLRNLKEKNIAVTNIDKFYKDFKSEFANNDD
jgi:hypothetical protein